MAWYNYRPYIPVAQRRFTARSAMELLRKQGVDIQPIKIEGRKIATSFWGKAWCNHLESFSDFSNRLPRGRTYVRNGSVCHLAIEKGKIEARVSGSDLYEVQVKIKTLSTRKWNDVKRNCSGQIGSLLELLRGNLSDHIMQVVTDRQKGLFPLSGEMSFDCDCPDWATMCKHIAAVLYGIGSRLDRDPALLFRLRGVNHDELIEFDEEVPVPIAAQSSSTKLLAADDLADVFGIDLVTAEPVSSSKGGKTTVSKRKRTLTKNKKTSSAKKSPSDKKIPSSKRSAKTATKKVSVRKKKTKRVTKKTSAKNKTAVQKKTAKKKTAKKKRSRKQTQPVS